MDEPMIEYYHPHRIPPDKEPNKYQSRLRNKEGRIYDVLVNVSLLADSDRTLATLIDITDAKHMEKNVMERDNAFILFGELQTIFNAMPGTLSIISSDMKIIWTNRNNRSRRGLPAVNVLMDKCFEAYHGLDKPCRDCPIIECFSTGEPRTARIHSPAGAIWDVKAFPIMDDSGKVLNVIDFAEDVTEKAKLELDAERSAHLASIGKLAAGVAHEINNPINGIINYAQILINDNRTGETHEIASRIVSEGTRIAGIVRSLLSFARQDREAKSAVSVRDIIDESLTLGTAMLRRDAIRLEIFIVDGLPMIYANAQQLQQVLLNLLSNAQHALNETSRETGHKKLSIIAESIKGGTFVSVSFIDNGIGIPAENLEKVMLPFFTTKPSGKGTGLGLSISHGIIADHGGTLSLQSIPGVSTTVTISLPAIREDA